MTNIDRSWLKGVLGMRKAAILFILAALLLGVAGVNYAANLSLSTGVSSRTCISPDI